MISFPPTAIGDLLTLAGTLLVVTLLILLWPILSPSTLKYPWPKYLQKNDGRDVVVLAGSYNPPHNGHLAMIQYLSERYAHVIAVIGFNPNKKYDVSAMDRAQLLEEMINTQKIGNGENKVRVEVVSTYIWRFAMAEGCVAMFRGIRSWKQDGREERMLMLLNTVGPIIYGPLKWPVPTIYLEGKPEYNHISSTLIRDMCKEASEKKVDLSSVVPKSLSDRVVDLYGKDKEA